VQLVKAYALGGAPFDRLGQLPLDHAGAVIQISDAVRAASERAEISVDAVLIGAKAGLGQPARSV